jgi:hypothetical protein
MAAQWGGEERLYSQIGGDNNAKTIQTKKIKE